MVKASAGTIWKSCLAAVADMERPSPSVRVAACVHTDGCMSGSCRTEHACELKVVIFSWRSETSLGMFWDDTTEWKTNVSHLNSSYLTYMQHSTFPFVPRLGVTTLKFVSKHWSCMFSVPFREMLKRTKDAKTTWKKKSGSIWKNNGAPWEEDPVCGASYQCPGSSTTTVNTPRGLRSLHCHAVAIKMNCTETHVWLRKCDIIIFFLLFPFHSTSNNRIF